MGKGKKKKTQFSPRGPAAAELVAGIHNDDSEAPDDDDETPTGRRQQTRRVSITKRSDDGEDSDDEGNDTKDIGNSPNLFPEPANDSTPSPWRLMGGNSQNSSAKKPTNDAENDVDVSSEGTSELNVDFPDGDYSPNIRDRKTPQKEDQLIELMQYIIDEPTGDLILDDAMWLLSHLCNEPMSSHTKLLANGAATAIAYVMRRAEASVDAQIYGCAAYWHLAESAEGEATLLEHMAMGEVLESFERYPDSPELQAVVLGALSALSCSELGQNTAHELNIPAFVIEAIDRTNQGHKDIRRHGCNLIAFLADKNETIAKTLLELNVMDRVFKCLNANDRIAMDAGVVSSACLALTRLLEHSDGRSSYWAAKPKSKKDKVDEEDIKSRYTPIILKCMKVHSNDADVMEHCSYILRLLCDGSSPSSRKLERISLYEAGAMDFLNDILAAFPQHVALHAHARHALAALTPGTLTSSLNFMRACVNDILMFRLRSNHGNKLVADGH
eukprot:m.265218 g.265218  ORF g.265218 m.265218 type:complete len:500 (+) comp16235_c1_seq4:1006-2505(+)